MTTIDPVLALETSTRSASVALQCGDAHFETKLEKERAHASDLVPTLDALFRRAGLEPGVPLPGGAVVVGTGPGSYTGLRVGIATALGLVRALEWQVRGVASLEALAFGTLEANERCTIVLNARASEFYVARYRRTENDVVADLEPCVRRAADVRALVAEEEIVLADESVARVAELAADVTQRLRTDVVPAAAALLSLGRRRLEQHGPQDPGDVDALYLRPFTTPSRRR